MAKIIVLGAGIGGIPTALETKKLLGDDHQVTVICDKETFDFTPSNPWVAVNWRKTEDIKVELAPMFAKKGIEFIAQAATKVDPTNNQITIADGTVLDYDYLVIATGPQLAFDEIAGLGPDDGHTISVCSTPHAKIAGDKWQDFLKNPGPIVIGAVQGASCYGPAYEYALLVDADLRKHKIRDKVPITFVTSEPYIGHLGLGGVGDTKSLLESKLRDASINWIINAEVKEITEDTVNVVEYFENGTSKEHDPIPYKHSMFLPAFKGIDPVLGIEGLVNPRGFITVNEYQQNETFKNVFGVGVCVAIPPVGKTLVPVGVPKTGYMIESMASATAHNISALINGEKAHKVPELNAFCLADFGDGGVAFIAKPQIPPRNLNWSTGGRWVHWSKIAFEKYFLKKVRKGQVDTFFEDCAMKLIGMHKLKK